jgi:hypothetical protein
MEWRICDAQDHAPRGRLGRLSSHTTEAALREEIAKLNKKVAESEDAAARERRQADEHARATEIPQAEREALFAEFQKFLGTQKK